MSRFMRGRTSSRAVAVGASIVALGAVALGACSSSDAPSTGGIMLGIRTDMTTPDSFDWVRVEVLQESDTPGTWVPLLKQDYRVPAEIRLPATLGLAAGTKARQEALVRVAALQGEQKTPRVLREVTTQLPTNRVAYLSMVLSWRCADKVQTSPAGDLQSSCGDGQSCNPDNGLCTSRAVDGASLPSYTPGEETADAGEVRPIADAAPTGNSDGSDASPPPVVDAGDSGPTAGPTGTIGAVGQACAAKDAMGCLGHGQKERLICDSNLRWASQPPCTGATNCDTKAGATAGTCKAIVAECAGRAPQAKYCTATQASVQCDDDQFAFTSTPCPNACTGAGVCSGTCKPGTFACRTGQYECDATGTMSPSGTGICDPACTVTGRFIRVPATNTVRDTTTGLVWERDMRAALGWTDAKAACAAAGFRLPTRSEALGAAGPLGCGNDAMDSVALPIASDASYLWTSEASSGPQEAYFWYWGPYTSSRQLLIDSIVITHANRFRCVK